MFRLMIKTKLKIPAKQFDYILISFSVKLFSLKIIEREKQLMKKNHRKAVKELVTSAERKKRADYTNEQVSFFVILGTARFELATSRTPSERATRLRYVPSIDL